MVHIEEEEYLLCISLFQVDDEEEANKRKERRRKQEQEALGIEEHHLSFLLHSSLSSISFLSQLLFASFYHRSPSAVFDGNILAFEEQQRNEAEERRRKRAEARKKAEEDLQKQMQQFEEERNRRREEREKVSVISNIPNNIHMNKQL